MQPESSYIDGVAGSRFLKKANKVKDLPYPCNNASETYSLPPRAAHADGSRGSDQSRRRGHLRGPACLYQRPELLTRRRARSLVAPDAVDRRCGRSAEG